jgi:hypothetical protein
LIKRGAVVGGAIVWTGPVVQSIRLPAFAQASPAPEPSPTPTPVSAAACFLVLDDEGIAGDKPPPGFTEWNVNQGVAGEQQRSVLPFFAAHVGDQIDLTSGQVGDQGWFAPQIIPQEWADAGPSPDGLQNYINATVPNGDLDQIPDVRPLRAAGFCALKGKTIAALVKDSNVGINEVNGQLVGDLTGAYKGKIAFEIVEVTAHPDGGSMLPVITIRILDATVVFAGVVHLCEVPVPAPNDVTPSC